MLVLRLDVSVQADDDRLAVNRGRSALIAEAAGHDQGFSSLGRRRLLHRDGDDKIAILDGGVHVRFFFRLFVCWEGKLG